ncbi:MAG: hypothetical protein HYR55_11835 [Acidobacteria bacterium]|nr:hypothetical protein [Acidobacteriota bacterium]MBI3655857.1 hypothetical protein [Acidobacteriota bacterium]
MKIFLYPSGIKVTPFNDPVSEIPIRNQTLEWHQRDAARRAGFVVARIQRLEEVDEPSGLLISDHVFFSAEILKKFLDAVAKRPGLWALAIPTCGFTEFTTPVQDVLVEPLGESTQAVYQIYAFNNLRPTAESLSSATRLPIRIKERRMGMDRVERVTEGRSSFAYYVTREFAFHVTHWSHILFANLYAVYYYWANPSPRMVMHFLSGLLRAHSINRWKIMAKLVRKGKHCDIHPSAIVEASVLGNGVKIGRHAAVFGSWLGDGAEVASGAEVIGSVLGENAVASSGARLVYCVLYPRALVGHQPMQGCMVGRGTMAAPATYLIDMKLGKNIRVEHQGQRVSVGKQFLGSCLGHNVFLGTGIWFDAGLEIPNGYVIVRDPDQIVRHIPKDLPPGEPLIARGDTLMLRPKKE